MSIRSVFKERGVLINRKDLEKINRDLVECYMRDLRDDKEVILLTPEFAKIVESYIDMTKINQMKNVLDKDSKWLDQHFDYIDISRACMITIGDIVAPVYVEFKKDVIQFSRFSDILMTLQVFSESYSTIEICFNDIKCFTFKVMPGETTIDLNIPVLCTQFQPQMSLKTLSGKVSKFRCYYLNINDELQTLLSDNFLVNPLFQVMYADGSVMSRYSYSNILGFDNRGMLKHIDTHRNSRKDARVRQALRIIRHIKEHYPKQFESITSDYFFKPEYIGFYSEKVQKLIDSFYEVAKSEESLLNDLPMEILDLITTEYTDVLQYALS